MTQVRYHTFQRPLDSFAENRRTLGVMNAGRYRGFDAFVQGGALDGTLIHTTTGVLKTDIVQAVSAPMSALITKQGVMIYEDAAVAIAGFSTNVGNFERRDLIVCEHEYLAALGGQAATYSIIEGVPASAAEDVGLVPELTNPEKQVVIGVMTIPAGEANLANAIYTVGEPNRGVLDSRTNGLALLDQAQLFRKMLSVNQGTNTAATDDAIKLPDDGNVFSVDIDSASIDGMEGKPRGTIISVIFSAGTAGAVATLNHFVGGLAVGMSPFLLPDNVSEAFASGDTVMFQQQLFGWVPLCSDANFLSIKTNSADIADIQAGELPLGVKTDGTLLRTKVVDIGDWNMDTTVGKNIAHGIALGISKIRNCQVIIQQDDGNFSADFMSGLSASGVPGAGYIPPEGSILIGNTFITLNRMTGGIWDGADFDAVAFNRGWITIQYTG